MTVPVLLVTYCVLIVLASVAGGRLPSLLRMTHLRTQLLMSFVGGLMLGIATLHLLPHAASTLGSSGQTGAGALIGIVAMFLLMRAFRPHHHGAAMPLPEGGLEPLGEPVLGREDQTHEHGEGTSGIRPGLGWIGLVFGLGLHTLIDGVALSASVVSDDEHGAWLGLAGLGTFLAIALHKPLDAFAITSTMRTGGWSRGHRDLINLLFSSACPLGAALFYLGVTSINGSEAAVGWGLALSAGFFLCIALADLLPEVSFHDHDRGKLTAALVLGIVLAVGVENLPGHRHAPDPAVERDHHASDEH